MRPQLSTEAALLDSGAGIGYNPNPVGGRGEMKRFVIAVLFLAFDLSPLCLAKEPYKIGAVFSITGEFSSLGVPERNTVKMIEEQINAEGGINGHPSRSSSTTTRGMRPSVGPMFRG